MSTVYRTKRKKPISRKLQKIIDKYGNPVMFKTAPGGNSPKLRLIHVQKPR